MKGLYDKLPMLLCVRWGIKLISCIKNDMKVPDNNITNNKIRFMSNTIVLKYYVNIMNISSAMKREQ